MTETTPPTEKKQNYPGLSSVWCGGVGFVSGLLFAGFQTKYHESLFTDTQALHIGGIFGFIWFISTALGLLCWFMSLFLVLPIWGTRFRATGTILGLLLPMLQTSVVMPTQGLAHYIIYYRVSDPVAIQYIQEFTESKEVIGRHFIKNTYQQNYSEPRPETSQPTKRSAVIIVKYELRHNVKDTNLPQSFSVIIDRKTKKTEIIPGNDTQPQPDKN
jgi:hypothetical protein